MTKGDGRQTVRVDAEPGPPACVQHLVRARMAGSADDSGDRRRTAPGTVGRSAEARRRHVATYLRLAEELRAKYADSTEDAEWFRRLDLEHDNLREAIRASLRADESADEPVSHRFVVALRKFWLVRNHYTEARAFLAPMLARCGAPSPARLDLLEASNTFAQLQFAYDVALDNVREGLALARSLGERYASRSSRRTSSTSTS